MALTAISGATGARGARSHPVHEESARFGEKDCAVSGGRHSAAPGS